jgi:hypothetical protein
VPVIGPDDFPPVPTPGAQCAWELNTSCCTGWADFDPAVQENAAVWATGILDALTAHRYAQCPVKLRPCGTRCGRFGGYLAWPVDAPSSSGNGFPWMIPFIDPAGVWRNCACAGACKCRATCEAKMPYPIAEVIEVLVDGVVLDPSSYRVDDGNILVRTDGECFPECQDMDLADTEPNTWSVTLRPGEVLPAIGALAAGELACEYAKFCAGSSDCTLPSQLQSLSRNGVQVEILDPGTLFDNGLTGLTNVDLFLRVTNPYKLKSRPRVYSPDVRNPRQVTI